MIERKVFNRRRITAMLRILAHIYQRARENGGLYMVSNSYFEYVAEKLTRLFNRKPEPRSQRKVLKRGDVVVVHKPCCERNPDAGLISVITKKPNYISNYIGSSICPHCHRTPHQREMWYRLKEGKCWHSTRELTKVSE